jgi:AcrR family transcriptional regulator
VTVEGIAARAGVAKQTIYRWWPSKVDILLDTLIEDADRQLPVPTSGPVLDGLRRYLRAFARFLAKEDAGRVLLALLGEAQHDPAVAATFHERYLDPRRAAERALLRRGIDAGELPSGLDVDTTLDALIGPLTYRALTGARLTPAFADGLLTAALERPR